jgi:hypothetical protein
MGLWGTFKSIYSKGERRSKYAVKRRIRGEDKEKVKE